MPGKRNPGRNEAILCCFLERQCKPGSSCVDCADENQSGTKASRPGLDRMMKAIEAGEIDTVVVFAFSRYARSVSHMLKGLEVMRSHKTNFVSLSEKLDLNTSLGHVVFVIISAIAQLERDLIAERIKNGLAAAKARGAKIGRARKKRSILREKPPKQKHRLPFLRQTRNLPFRQSSWKEKLKQLIFQISSCRRRCE
jgi:DNA invertase Pin-like site-specific DNA recombinase